MIQSIGLRWHFCPKHIIMLLILSAIPELPNRRLETLLLFIINFERKCQGNNCTDTHTHEHSQVTCILTIWHPQLRSPNEHMHSDYLTKIRCTTISTQGESMNMLCGNLIKVSNCIKDMCNRQLVNVKLNTKSRVKCSAQEFHPSTWMGKMCVRWE